MANAPLTRADRLHALIAKVAPQAAAQHAADGTWPNTHPEPGQKRDEAGAVVEGQPARHSGAPYEVRTLQDGRQQLRITGEDGDVVAGVGATFEDALQALETKLGVAAPAAKE